MFSRSIAVIGLWHLGEIYSAGLAELEHHVVGISEDKAVVENLNRGTPPLPEPGLEELIKKNEGAGRLSYTSDFAAVRDCDVVWFTFDVPVDDNDNVDLSVIWKTLDHIAPHLKQGVLIVVSSQVPVGTGKDVDAFLRKRRPDLKWEYTYSPENLRLGEAVKCFLEPGRVVVGSSSPRALAAMEEIFAPLRTEIIAMSVPSAEMGKHALNAFLATCVCFGNEMADICEKVGADAMDVLRVLRSDARVGSRLPLSPGLGFSGGTLARDVNVLRGLAAKFGVDPSFIARVYEKNEARKSFVTERLENILAGVKGKTVVVFGLTYKPGTKTLRRSLSLETARQLAVEGATLRLSDPMAELAEVPQITSSSFFRDPYEAARGAHAIVLMTPWPEFKQLDFAALGSAATSGALFFDATNFLRDKQVEIEKAGFRYQRVGKAPK